MLLGWMLFFTMWFQLVYWMAVNSWIFSSFFFYLKLLVLSFFAFGIKQRNRWNGALWKLERGKGFCELACKWAVICNWHNRRCQRTTGLFAAITEPFVRHLPGHKATSVKCQRWCQYLIPSCFLISPFGVREAKSLVWKGTPAAPTPVATRHVLLVCFPLTRYVKGV